MDTLEELKPRRRRLVYDLAKEAGFDTTDWIASSSRPNAYKANPKYCYNWSLLAPGKVLILNLWYDTLDRDGHGAIICSENYRKDAADLRAQGGKGLWIRRGAAFDRQLQEAARDAVPIRVIINDGVRRARGDASAAQSHVAFRDLDPEPWHVRSYDRVSGAFVLARGMRRGSLMDQFDIDPAQPQRREAMDRSFVRDAGIRRAALARSGGRCELCGQEGFETSSGRTYLETHHIVPLGDGGPDILANVIALCPNDHRRAHFAIDREDLRHELRRRIVH